MRMDCYEWFGIWEGQDVEKDLARLRKPVVFLSGKCSKAVRLCC
jgi:hypothetical protein